MNSQELIRGLRPAGLLIAGTLIVIAGCSKGADEVTQDPGATAPNAMKISKQQEDAFRQNLINKKKAEKG